MKSNLVLTLSWCNCRHNLLGMKCIKWLQLCLDWVVIFLHWKVRFVVCAALFIMIHFNFYHPSPVAVLLFFPSSVRPLLAEGREWRDNCSHPIKAVLALQFLKVLPCDSLINQACYLNLAGSKSNKRRLSGKNTASRHSHMCTYTYICVRYQCLSVWNCFSVNM